MIQIVMPRQALQAIILCYVVLCSKLHVEICPIEHNSFQKVIKSFLLVYSIRWLPNLLLLTFKPKYDSCMQQFID